MDGLQCALGAVRWAPRGEWTLQMAENGQTTTVAGQDITNWQGSSDSSEGGRRVNKAAEGFLHEPIMFVEMCDANKGGPIYEVRAHHEPSATTNREGTFVLTKLQS